MWRRAREARASRSSCPLPRNEVDITAGSVATTPIWSRRLSSDYAEALSNQRQAESRVGSQAGPYLLERVLDVGGMATVYVASRRGRAVALKLMHNAYKSMEEARVRFKREAYVANTIDHEDVVKVLDDGTTSEGNPFFVMELLQGASLDKRLAAHGTLSPRVVVTLADRILDVLRAAHARGVWHRDIKPGNVFITREGRLKVLDFGLAYVGDGPSMPQTGLMRFGRKRRRRLTRGGTVIGTAAYMSPEQATLKHDRVDGRTDLFSVGAVMFRCLTGQRIFPGADRASMLLAAATQQAPSLAERGAFPEALVRAVDRALAFERDDRWTDAAAMQEVLRRLPLPCDPPPEWKGEASKRVDDSELSIPISVSFHESVDDSSILVEVDSEHRWELRPTSHDGSFEVVPLDELDD